MKSSALFKFDGSTQDDLLPLGKAQIDQLARAIQTTYQSVDSITIVGYTDRLGSNAYNDQLSIDRANAVKTRLQSGGLIAPIAVQGRGQADPIVDCSGSKASHSLKECLQPNRRVEVIIEGRKR